jgi:hypothetical protein
MMPKWLIKLRRHAILTNGEHEVVQHVRDKETRRTLIDQLGIILDGCDATEEALYQDRSTIEDPEDFVDSIETNNEVRTRIGNFREALKHAR